MSPDATPQTTVPMQSGAFHWRDGWHFRRIEGGDVEITLHEPHEGRQVVTQRLTIPAAEWVSIVAAVSEAPDKSATYVAAGSVHAGEWRVEVSSGEQTP